MSKRYETAERFGAESRSKQELGKEVQLRAKILKKINKALNKTK